ncbi:hypothetical protein [Chromobacterium haemolyticum]|uniref:hypothetical protein n=1 Tax=Chromobacterium haemolyticum TaxID=394935 RepID=UPI001317E629|nr:hypothetical protein [Chromobacterium haemolyticum]BBH12919.1 hypothetical protein CH06BL_21670 [Chromobacterium haemolyticum]
MATYALRLKGFTPETLPLERLSKYLTALADLVGKDAPIHFDKVSKGSAMLKLVISDDQAHALESRVRLAAFAEAGSELKKAYDQINMLARGDQTTAEFKPVKGAVILQFPGINKPEPRTYSVKEDGEINGRVIRLGGKDSTVPVGLQMPDGVVVSCTASLDQAKGLKVYLLEPIDIVLKGSGKWVRDVDGAWVLEEFKISEFFPLVDQGFDEQLAKIRSKGSGWGEVEDIDKELHSLRYGE